MYEASGRRYPSSRWLPVVGRTCVVAFALDGEPPPTIAHTLLLLLLLVETLLAELPRDAAVAVPQYQDQGGSGACLCLCS